MEKCKLEIVMNIILFIALSWAENCILELLNVKRFYVSMPSGTHDWKLIFIPLYLFHHIGSHIPV